MPPQLPPIGGEVPADLWPMVYPPLPPIGGEVLAQPYARGTRLPEGDLPPEGTARSVTVPGSVQVADPNAATPMELQVGGVPYVRGAFTPQELETIGRSPAAQAVQPPGFTPAPPPAPEPTPMGTITRGRFTGLPGRNVTSATPEPLTEGTIQLAQGVAHGSRYYTQPTNQTLNAASDVLEGAMKIGTPLVVAGAIADLPGTVLALGASYVAGKAAKAGAHAAGASPEMERFLENLGAAATAVVGGRAVARGVTAGTSSTARALILAAKLSGRTIGEARPVGAGATVTEAAQVTRPGYHAPIEALDSGTPSSVQQPRGSGPAETLAEILAESPAVETLREQFPDLSAEELDALIRQYGGTAHQATFLERPSEAAASLPVTPLPPGAPSVPAAPVAAQTPLPTVGEPVPEPLTPAGATPAPTPPLVDEAGRPTEGYAGPERRVAEGTPPAGTPERRAPGADIAERIAAKLAAGEPIGTGDARAALEAKQRADTTAEPAVRFGSYELLDLADLEQMLDSANAETAQGAAREIKRRFGAPAEPETPPTALATRPSLALQLGSDPHVRAVDSLEHAAQMVDTLRDQHEQATGQGVSSFPKTTVIDTTTGKPVATISYNGRIWDATSGQEINRPDNRGYGKPAPIDVTATEPTPTDTDREYPTPLVEAIDRGVAPDRVVHWTGTIAQQLLRGRELSPEQIGDMARELGLTEDQIQGVTEWVASNPQLNAIYEGGGQRASLPAIGAEVPQPASAAAPVVPSIAAPTGTPASNPKDWNAVVRQFRSRLTRAQNAAKVAAPIDKPARLQAVIAEADAFNQFFTDHPPFPDQWHRWQRAREDAQYELDRLNKQGHFAEPGVPIVSPAAATPPAAPATTEPPRGAAKNYAVGDRVGVEGRSATVAGIQGEDVRVRFDDGTEVLHHGSRLTPPPAFKVGDRVTADEGTGQVSRIDAQGANVKVALDTGGALTHWIPITRLQPASPEAPQAPPRFTPEPDAAALAGAPGTSYKVEVTDGSGYSSNGFRFATKAEAEHYGRELLSRWSGARDFRVAESADAVTHVFDEDEYKAVPIGEAKPKPPAATVPASAPAPAVEPKHAESVSVRAFEVLAKALQSFGLDKPFPKRADEFRTWMAEKLGTTSAALAEDIDAINDAAEAALADHLREDLNRVPVSTTDALDVAQRVEALLPKAHRTLEKTKLQQFSTPLPIAVLAGRAAQVQPGDRVLEPTAGTGNLLVGVPTKADVTTVELSARRADLLRAQGYNVVQGDYLGAKVTAPTVIISNPPWGKYSKQRYGKPIALGFTPSDVAERFVAKMLRDLAPGGRVVAVMPTTMFSSASFKAWLQDNFDTRAIIQAPPGAYDTRATNVDSVLLVVDKPALAKGQPHARTPLPATVAPADWKAYAQAVEGIPPREHRLAAVAAPGSAAPEGRPGRAPRPAPLSGPERVPERQGPDLADAGRDAPVPEGRDTGVVAGQPGPAPEPEPAGVGPTVVEQPDRATLGALAEPEGEFADVVDHAADERRAAAGSRQFAPYVRRTALWGVGHPKLIVEARQLAGVAYPKLTITPGRAIREALKTQRVSIEQAEQALAAVQANVDGHYGYLAADNVGVGKSRELALVVLDLMERAKADGRELRLVITTKSADNVADLIDNELFYVARGRTRDGRDLLNVDAPRDVPEGLDFEIVKTTEWPDAKREGQAYKPLPRYPRAVYVTDFYNLAAFRQALVDVTPHGIIGDEAHRFKNVEGAAAGGAWQNLHAHVMRNVPREEQVFAYFTATPAQSVNDYQYLYGLRLWPIDGFTQWVRLATGAGDEEDAAALAAATEAGAFNIDRVADAGGDTVIGGDSEDTAHTDRPRFGTAGFSDIFSSRLTPAEAEQIPREWKMLGRFSARDLWRHGQEFTIHEAKLKPEHRAKYDQFAQLAQDIASAAYQFGLLDKSGKSSRFGVTGQLQFAAKRIQMQPALEEAITVAQEKLAQGYQVVLSVINVTEMDPEHGNIAAAIEKINTRIKDTDPDDPDGGIIDQGEIPEALIVRAELLEQAKALGKFPDPVEMVEQAFGKQNVAFIIGDSGAQRRVAMKEFQEGKRTVALLSAAGSTGINLDHRVLTPTLPGRGRRVFIDVQFEWSATEAIQRYGRVGRAASVTQPILMPLTFGNASEKKFLATIANRMSALGALSKGGAETTGAEGLEEFEILGPEATEAARRAYNDLALPDKRKFAVVSSVFRSPSRGNDDPFEPAATAPSTAQMRNFQLALLFVPLDTSNAFWQSFVTHREAIREALGHQTASRTEAFSGEILRTSTLGTAEAPLQLDEVKNQKGQRFGVLSGLITPRMPKIRDFLRSEDAEGRSQFVRRYVTFTAGSKIVAGLQIPWARVHALAEAFGRELTREKLDTPAKVLAALKAGETVTLQQETDGTPWTLRLRKDEKVAVAGAKMADRALLLHNGGGFSPVGNFWFTTEAKLAQFLERFPVRETATVKPTKTPPRSSSSGPTLQATVLPGATEFVEQDVVPGLKNAAAAFAQAAAQLQRSVAPATVGAGAEAAGSLRAMMAREAQENAQMTRASVEFQKAFDRLLATPAGRDQAIDWWDAVQTGHPTTILPELQPAYAYMRQALDRERDEIQKFGKLEDFNEFYFPQIWKFPKQEAQWIRRKIAGLLGKRPFEGSKGFLKQRKYPTFREGLAALTPKGVEPISYNPVDHFLIKMREMRRYRVAHESIADFKAMGIWRRFGGPFGKKPDGWTRIEGPLGTIYGPPTVGFKEAFDPDLFEGLERFARDLGVHLSRRPNIGGRRWGYAEGDRFITTKAAGPETVLMHEIGHILDERYGLRGMVKEKKFKQELRDLADLRHEGTPKDQVRPGRLRYERKGEEKIANLVHAFIYAPERAKKIAPNSYWALFNLAKDHKALAPLITLQKTRSLKLGTRSHQIDIGGFPEIGYYAMPDDAARIFNNHLSRGLAGRSAIYDAYRWLNNSMVTGQLAFSGLFHLTFTGLNALASEGGLSLRELTRAAQTKNWALAAQGAKRLATAGALGTVGAAAGYTLGGPAGVLWATGYPLAAMKFVKGWKAQRQWLTTDPAGRFFADHVRQMQEGGFRPTWDQFYDNGAMQNAIRALRTGNYPGALARAIPAALDAVTRPIMSWFVPAVKAAAYLDMAAFELGKLQREVAAVEDAEHELAQLPQTPRGRAGLDPNQKAIIAALEAQRADNLAVIRAALNRAQASVDNRFGEVVYDNWFWQRWLKDLTHVTFRSPGWQFGTYKEVGGAVTSQARILIQRAAGGGGGSVPPTSGGAEATGAADARTAATDEDLLSGQMAWLLALIGMTMLMGGLSHYLATGERPKGRDWIYPKGPDGQRRAIPTYLRTIISAYLHPVRTAGSITAPLNTALYRLLISNETYSGEVIREPGDPFLRQAWDALKFATSEGYQPFVVQNVRRGEGRLESTMGVAPAPAEIQRSAAENYLHDVMPRFTRTHEEQAHTDARRALRDAITKKDAAAGKAAIAEGALSRRSVIAVRKSATRDPLVRAFEAATLPQALRAYELATPEERSELRPLLGRKMQRLIAQVPRDERAAMQARYGAAVKLPMAAPPTHRKTGTQ